MVKNVGIEELFLGMQEELLAKLNTGKKINHAPTQGDDTEMNWISALSSLPSRYAVDKGFVIDASGSLSEQMDIVVYDRYYSPIIFRRDSTLYIPAESVYAVFEVRPKLTKANIAYARKKALSVRSLKRNSAPVRQIDGSLKKKDVLPPIIAGIISAESGWKEPFGKEFITALSGAELNSRLDIGVALRNGSFTCVYDKAGALTVECSNADKSLISFFVGLTKQLQQLGNAPGIDLDAYFK